MRTLLIITFILPLIYAPKVFGDINTVKGDKTIIQAEYFFSNDPANSENDPGLGEATPLEVNNNNVVPADIDTSNLPFGKHYIIVRLKDSDGNWGPTRQHAIEIQDPYMLTFQSAEYFIGDKDPGKGGATLLTPNDDGSFGGIIETADMGYGISTISVRIMDSLTRWGKLDHKQFEVREHQHPTINGNITTFVAGWHSLPVRNATVILKDTDYTTESDSKGNFKFLDIPIGEYTLMVNAQGLIPISKQFKWNGMQNLYLKELPIPLAIFDPDQNGLVGLPEAINALQVVAGIKHVDYNEIPNDDNDQNGDGWDIITWYKDIDNDGYPDSNSFNITASASHRPIGFKRLDELHSKEMDCNDDNSNVHPNAQSIPDNDIDEDCDEHDPKSPSAICTNQFVHCGETIILDGSNSHDSNCYGCLSYFWELTDGVIGSFIAGKTSKVAKFKSSSTACDEGQTSTFSLTVKNQWGIEDTAECQVTYQSKLIEIKRYKLEYSYAYDYWTTTSSEAIPLTYTYESTLGYALQKPIEGKTIPIYACEAIYYTKIDRYLSKDMCDPQYCSDFAKWRSLKYDPQDGSIVPIFHLYKNAGENREVIRSCWTQDQIIRDTFASDALSCGDDVFDSYDVGDNRSPLGYAVEKR